jgi:type IV secretion/conjugal transfer VirB4 family ATPase
MKRAGLRGAPIFPAFVRPPTVFGCDPRLFSIVATVAAILVFPAGLMRLNFVMVAAGVGILFGFVLWMNGQGKRDPQWLDVWWRSLRYARVYAARARWDVREPPNTLAALLETAAKAIGLKPRTKAPKLRGTQPDRGFADLLAYSAAVGDGVWALKDCNGSPCGPLLAGFWYEGVDLESSSWQELERIRYNVNTALRTLDATWVIQPIAFRRVEHRYVEGACSAPVDELINEERREDARYFVTDYALFLCQAQPAMDKPGAQKVRRVLLGEQAEAVVDENEARIQAFEERLKDLEESLSVGLKRLRRMRWTPENDELRSAVSYAVNGVLRRCKSPLHPVHLDADLARDMEWSVDAEMVSYEDAISVVGLTNLPPRSVPAVLGTLSVLGVEYMWSSRFMPFDYLSALGKMNALDKRWKQKGDDDGVDRRIEVAEARKELEQRLVTYGHYTSAIVLRERIDNLDDAKSRRRAREAVEEKARLVAKALQENGFEAIIERRNRMEAFLGSLPGHGVENVRKPMINTINVADMIPIAREWTGSENAPCPFYPPGSTALLQGRTWSGAPFYLNVHQGDLGHTAIFGPPGKGKSTLLALMVSQFSRYEQSQVFVVDFGMSMYALTLAQDDGVHYALGGNDTPELCPLAEIDTIDDRAWAAEWVASLCEAQKVELTPDLRGVIFRAVEELAQCSTRPEHRTLSDFRVHLQHPKLNAVLDYYTTGVGGSVLNGKSDALQYARFSTFETERLFSYGEAVVSPVLAYLFRQIEKRLDGRPTFLVIDEAWLALRRYSDKLREWLKTLRKKNCAVIIATQNLSDVVNSPIADVVFECCPTKILLPNEMASVLEELYIKRLQLNEAQVETLTRAEGKRWYMQLIDGRSRMFSLDLGPVARAFVGAGSKGELARVRALHERHGGRWASEWLAERGLPEAAVRLRELQTRARRRAS